MSPPPPVFISLSVQWRWHSGRERSNNGPKVTQPESRGTGVEIQLRVTLQPEVSGMSLAQYLTLQMVSGSKVGKMRVTSRELEAMGKKEEELLLLKK